MANRRMLSLQIVDSDAFLDMPERPQNLYFHLNLRADDDGFVDNVRKIMRMTGAAEKDLQALISKRFLISFPSGVVVIKHWRIHNYIQNDRYHPTKYVDEKKSLLVKENGSYTECIQNVLDLDTQTRLGKTRLELDKNTGTRKSRVRAKKETEYNPLGAEIVKAFEEVDPKNKTYYGNKTQRGAADFLISEYGLDKVLKVIAILRKTNGTSYFPSITSPNDLKEKWSKLEGALLRKKGEKTNKGRGVEV